VAETSWHGGGDLITLTNQHVGETIGIQAGGALLTTENAHDYGRERPHQRSDPSFGNAEELAQGRGSTPSAVPPSKEDSRLVPLPVDADPMMLLVRLAGISAGCRVRAFANCGAPPGLATRPANALRIDGTTALIAVCVTERSRPDTEASLPTISDVKIRDMFDMMLLAMELIPSYQPQDSHSTALPHADQTPACETTQDVALTTARDRFRQLAASIYREHT
jgi:hypothetical protein